MPSQFPGMDPYLEHPAIFPGVHDRFIAYLSEALQARLPEPYYADITDRVWVEVYDRLIGPDVNVLHQEEHEGAEPGANGGVIVATRTMPMVIRVLHDEHREPLINIYTRVPHNEQLVTTIEVLSLAIKSPGEKGQQLYLEKQKEVLESPVSLVEIDLLRGGTPTTVARNWWQKYARDFDYHVCLCPPRGSKQYAYPFRLADMLPEISVPLLAQDGAVAIDLQEVFDRVYDAGPYRRRVQYGVDAIEPPLTTEQKEWHDTALKASS